MINKKVLVVDDQEMIRRLVKMTLSGEGYDVFEAKDGLEALNMAQQELPDLIILDVMMPGELDGVGVCRTLRSFSTMNETIILMLSAKTQAIDKEVGMCAGATDYLAKPFSPEYLLGQVREYLA